MPNGSHSSETSYSGVYVNLPILSGYSGLLQLQKGCSETHLNALSKKWNSAGGDMSWHNIDMPESRKRDELPLPPVMVPEKKRTRNIGSKSKRLLIDSTGFPFECKYVHHVNILPICISVSETMKVCTILLNWAQ